MSVQNLAMNSDSFALSATGVEELGQQVKQIVVTIRSLANTGEQETEIVDGRPLAVIPEKTVMCPW